MTVHPAVKWLSFTLYIGAAFHDATGQQRRELSFRIRPLLDELKSDNAVGETILEQVTEVMGVEWRPTGEWDRQITALLGKGSP